MNNTSTPPPAWPKAGATVPQWIGCLCSGKLCALGEVGRRRARLLDGLRVAPVRECEKLLRIDQKLTIEDDRPSPAAVVALQTDELVPHPRFGPGQEGLGLL